MDHGGFTKYQLRGADATRFLSKVFCTQLPEIGRVKLAYMLTPDGKIWSEATIARLDENEYLLCGPTLADLRDHDWLRNQINENSSVELQRGSEHDAALLLMGPESRNLLSQLTDHCLSSQSMPWMSVARIKVAGCETTAMRVSYVGELGWELHMNSTDLEQVYKEICRIGAGFNLVDFGSYALNAMRLEKSYHAWAADFSSEYSMFDAGLEKFIDNSRNDYIGYGAVQAQQNRNPDWRFVKLIIDSKDADPIAGDPVIHGGDCVGYITSGGSGFRIGQCIALGYIKASINDSISEFEVEILGELRSAVLARQAFYDPDNKRLLS